MIDSNSNNAAAIIAAARELGQFESRFPQKTQIGNLDVLVKSDGTIISLEKYANAPRRKRAKVAIVEAHSFIDYVNRHKSPGSTQLFGRFTETGGSFVAILDYHSDVVADLPDAPAWGEHQATLDLITTPEWQCWVGANGKLISQEAFAEFIEDNLDDIIRPDAATLLEFAQGLAGKKHVAFKSGKNLRDGSIQLEYIETIEVNGATNRRDDKFKLPDRFTLGLVPFVGANGVEIDARLRFRIGDNAKLSFAYILNRPYKLIEAAFNATRDDIEKATGLKVLLGAGAITAV